jgi:hypothetical protein
MKAYWEWRYRSTHSLTSALDGGEWSASRPGRFTPRKRAPCTHWIGGWEGPRAVLDAVVKRKIPSVNILDEDINTKKKKTNSQLDASRKDDPEVNTEKTMWLCLVNKI